MEKEAEVTLRFQDVEPIAPPAVQLDEVSFSYNPDRTILRNVNLSASSESRICIVSLWPLNLNLQTGTSVETAPARLLSNASLPLGITINQSEIYNRWARTALVKRRC